MVSGRLSPAWPVELPQPQPERAMPPLVAPYASMSPVLPPAPPAPPGGMAQIPLRIVPRTLWTRRAPVPARLNPMAGINSITVHHEGWKPVWFEDTGSTVERLQFIQNYHIDQRTWGDVGYHFIIDRAGRIWEGRPLTYQGAHVKDHNEHNVGVMVLGNFDNQSPSQPQMITLQKAVLHLMQSYRVPVNRVFTHQEINPTNCPGRTLQPRVKLLRQNIT
jgi:hypothetical protein